MNSSRSSPKPRNKASFKPVAPFAMFYQLTYMSAMASAGITRGKTFELAARSSSPAAVYFEAINTLVAEMRLDYAEACRRVGLQAKSDNMRSFLLRLSDALRSGEPLADFLEREAAVMSQAYENQYERDLEGLKQWTNAFSSMIISVALIVIIQVISSMIYSADLGMMTGLVSTGVLMACFGAWIIYRSAPREVMNVPAAEGSQEQRRSYRLARTMSPVVLALVSVFYLFGVPMGWILIVVAALLLPVGWMSMVSDRKNRKKDDEFSTFLRSTGGMASSSGLPLKEALGKIDLTSFPMLETDIQRLATRLNARVNPDICWYKFGTESGSRLISEVTAIFYGAVKIGGDPERVGYFCSLFTAKTTQLRAKRRLTAGTFSGLTTVMQAVVAGLMVFVLSIVENFAMMVRTLMPEGDGAEQGRASMNMGMADFSDSDLQFLTTMTVSMVVLLAIVSAVAIILGDGGYKLKVALFLSLTVFISGVSMLVVPPMVSQILTM